MGVVRHRRTWKWTQPRTAVSPAEWQSAWGCLWLCGLGSLALLLTLYWGIEQEITLFWMVQGEWRVQSLIQARQHETLFSVAIGLTLASGIWFFLQGLLALGQYRSLRRQRFWRRHHRYRLRSTLRHPPAVDFADTQPWAYAIPPEFADTEPMSWPPDTHPAPRH